MNIAEILDFISGRSPELAGKIQEWISGSESNREEYYHIKQLWAQRTAEEHSSPEALDIALKGIRDRIAIRENARRTRRSLILAWSVAAALAVVVAAGTLSRVLPPLSPVELSNTASAVSRHTLPDGTEVFLRQNASLTYGRRFGVKSRDVRLTGEAYFNVRKDTVRPFVVRTSCAEVKVLGTSFNVSARERTDVVLETGRVRLGDARGRVVADLIPGDRATIGPDGDFTIDKVKTGRYTNWHYDYQIYEKCTFDEFVLLVENRYDVRFVYDPVKFKDTYFRLALSGNDSLDDILNMMDFIAHIKYETNGRNIYIDKR
ncbi:MAG: FecR family protein [Candidatus Cryptobacteroides sp.]